MSWMDWDWDTICNVGKHIAAISVGVVVGVTAVCSFGAIPAMGVAVGAIGLGVTEGIAVKSKPNVVIAQPK